MALAPEEVLAKAAANLRRLQDTHPSGMAASWLARWQEVLNSGLDTVFDALTSRAPWAVELRRNSPFAGVLAPEERETALASFAPTGERSTRREPATTRPHPPLLTAL
ncbi:hypothetical protein RIF23_10290 [Lipingzhangella sp. LS1_29]|uniref:Uncharacterized protein n=1 Tax=Lipingzhangella rawalii TaxID=2055835 RepID=A0ABU2H5V3_9ACTN|nr:hypothetical protein [Lipingzhangella rawalii]MDS1270687.1 hypothetical protein [Lipingzhangella rawalii]